LSVILHQINNLERQDLKGNTGEREGEAGQDTDEPSEQSDNLPSGYGEIIVNDEMVYKTRVKQYTTMPYFEAGTEVFVRDYRDTVVRVVIRDSRLREADPILGIVSVRLSEVFAESSSVTQVYAITEGIGFGK
jgi:Ca2+-dependent lipid-binding protein